MKLHKRQASAETGKHYPLSTVLLSTAALMGLHLLCLLVGTLDFSAGRFFSFFLRPTAFFLNLLPLVLLFFLFYALSNRVWIAFLLTGIPAGLINFINYFKIQHRGDPLQASDFLLVHETADSLSNYHLDFPLLFFLTIAYLLGFSLLLWRFAGGRFPKKQWWLRLGCGSLCVLLGLLSWKLWYSDRELYGKQENTAFPLEYDAEFHASHGQLWSFLHSLRDVAQLPPEDYDPQQARALLEAYSDASIPSEQRVNVVVTMLESYSDLSALPGVTLNKDPYAPLHALQAESYHGTLISDTIGGGTVNAERSFLTGFTYPQHRYTQNSTSFVRYFKSQGYQTDGSHPGNEWFYKRSTVNAYLGFDRYLFLENYYEPLREGRFVMDEALFPAMREVYQEQTAAGEPYFSFSLTYQNHSPYENTKLLGEEYLSRGSLSEEAYYLINNYLHGAADTSRQIAAYVDSFREDETPVVLVFFGDHRPTMGAGNCYYEALGVNVAERSAEGCHNLYSTPYLIWANDAAKELLGQSFRGEGRTISPAFLMAELFDCCGWEGPAWMQYQRSCREQLSVIHRQSMYLEPAQGGLSSQLSPAGKEAKKQYDMVEYYLRTTLYPNSEE